MRPTVHFAPARGWLNDPNGLIEHRGVHHLFYQHNPRELALKDMCWGHASSTDLVTWTEHPIALSPGPEGSYDADGCWSGCAIHDADGSVVVVYSGNHSGVQLPCVARALDDDLIAWEKSADNPVIDHRPPVAELTEMRDHSVRRDGLLWRQVLAVGAAGEGLLVGYSSPDLISWSWDGIVLEPGDTGLPGQIWECPDVFETRAGDAVAIFSVIDGDQRPGPVVWVTGNLDDGTLIPLRWGLVDHGDRFYAPQSYSDQAGRRIMFGWLVTQLDPAALGQDSIGVASLPRILSVNGGRLCQRPAAEIRRLRGEPASPDPADSDSEGDSDSDSETDSETERRTRLLPPRSALEVEVSCQSTEELLGISIDLDDGRQHLIIDLALFSSSGRVLRDGSWRADSYEPHTATVVFDCGIVEVFLDDGRAATVTDARLQVVREVRISGTSAAATVIVWPLSTR